VVPNTQQRIVKKNQYPSIGSIWRPEQLGIIYTQKHFDKFKKEVTTLHITRIRSNVLYHKRLAP
jgi:hypothetical protein